MSRTEDIVREIGQPIAEELGYELVKIEYTKEGKKWFLRLYIDRPEGISLDDCVLFSERIGEALDSIDPDPIPQAYYLEVSSVGAERPLENDQDFKNAVGKYIQTTLHEAVEGQSIYEGTLDEVSETDITLTTRIKTRDKQVVIPKDKIAKAQLTVKL